MSVPAFEQPLQRLLLFRCCRQRFDVTCLRQVSAHVAVALLVIEAQRCACPRPAPGVCLFCIQAADIIEAE